MVVRQPIIHMRHVRMVKKSPDGDIRVLPDVTLEVPAGKFVAITGGTPAMQSTLFRVMAGEERPTSGTVIVEGESLYDLSEPALSARRRKFCWITGSKLPQRIIRIKRGMLAVSRYFQSIRLLLISPPQDLFMQMNITRRQLMLPAWLNPTERRHVIMLARGVTVGCRIFLIDAAVDDDVLRVVRQVVDELGLTVVAAGHTQGIVQMADRTITLCT